MVGCFCGFDTMVLDHCSKAVGDTDPPGHVLPCRSASPRLPPVFLTLKMAWTLGLENKGLLLDCEGRSDLGMLQLGKTGKHWQTCGYP